VLTDATTLGDATDPVNLAAVAYAREGKNYIADAYIAPAFKRYILYGKAKTLAFLRGAQRQADVDCATA